jgi:hypothetical protein
MRDLDSLVLAKPGTASVSITAGGAGDNSEQTGPTLDRYALSKGRGESAVLAVQLTATMASGETGSVLANFQDSANDSDWADYGAVLASTAVLTAAGGAMTAGSGTIQLGVSLAGARRYIRAQTTANLSRAGTDTALMSSIIVIGGQAQLPAA